MVSKEPEPGRVRQRRPALAGSRERLPPLDAQARHRRPARQHLRRWRARSRRSFSGPVERLDRAGHQHRAGRHHAPGPDDPRAGRREDLTRSSSAPRRAGRSSRDDRPGSRSSEGSVSGPCQSSSHGRRRSRSLRPGGCPRDPGQASCRRRDDVRRRGGALRPGQRRAVARAGPGLAPGGARGGGRPAGRAGARPRRRHRHVERAVRRTPGATVVPTDLSLGMLRVGKQRRPGAGLRGRRRAAAAVRRRRLRRRDHLLRAAQRRGHPGCPDRDAPGDPARAAGWSSASSPRPTWAPFRRRLHRVPDGGAAPDRLASSRPTRRRTCTWPSRSAPGPTRPGWPRRITAAGWRDVAWRNLSGGIVALHRGVR